MALIDFDFLNEISGGDAGYMSDVLDIFLSTVPDGIENLNKLILETEDWDSIYKLSHSLKSSLGIVKVGNLLELMTGIEANAMKEKDKAKAISDIQSITATFDEARPQLLTAKEEYDIKKAR